jgi:ABC-type glycerol-3-phosphate transport system substrate-binding protein
MRSTVLKLLAAATLAAVCVIGSLALLGPVTPISQARPASGEVSGSIVTHTTWTLADSPITLTAMTTDNPGITLTIEPGVEVRAKSGVYLTVRGNLIALGTPTSPSPLPRKPIPALGNGPAYCLTAPASVSRVLAGWPT